jgi:hypothetical protein
MKAMDRLTHKRESPSSVQSNGEAFLAVKSRCKPDTLLVTVKVAASEEGGMMFKVWMNRDILGSIPSPSRRENRAIRPTEDISNFGIMQIRVSNADSL